MSDVAIDRNLSPASRWRIVVLLMIFAGLAHFNRVGISVAGGEIFIKKLGISEIRMGWVYTTFLIVYTLGMLPGGWLIDRIGSARALTLLGFFMGLFVAVTGLLGYFTSSPETLWMALLFIRGFAGLCSSPLHPAAAHVVAETLPMQGRPTANGMVTAGALVGIAFSYPVFGGLMDRVGWPMAFILCGIVLAGYGALWKVSTKSTLGTKSHAFISEASSPGFTTSLSILRRGSLWLLTLSYAAYGYFQYLFMYWMSYYFEKVLKVSEIESREATCYIMLAQGAGMAIGGLSTDFASRNLGTTRGRRIIVMAGMGLGALFGLIGVSLSGKVPVAVSLALSMAALGMCEGVFWTTATDFGGKSAGFSGAFMNTGGNLGGLISPVLTPIMAERIGWPGAITVACVISGLGGIIWFLIRIPAAESLLPLPPPVPITEVEPA